MKDFLELLKKRRSIRKYKNIPVEEEKIDAVTKAALLSPSSRGIYPCDFIVVDDRSLLEKLSSCRPHGAGFVKNAQFAVVVAADTSMSDVWVEDASLAALDMQLAAESEGLGTCWVQVRNRDHSPGCSTEKYIRELLSIPEGWAVECIIAGGYPDEKLPSRELSGRELKKVRKNGFNRQ